MCIVHRQLVPACHQALAWHIDRLEPLQGTYTVCTCVCKPHLAQERLCIGAPPLGEPKVVERTSSLS